MFIFLIFNYFIDLYFKDSVKEEWLLLLSISIFLFKISVTFNSFKEFLYISIINFLLISFNNSYMPLEEKALNKDSYGCIVCYVIIGHLKKNNA